MLGILSLGAVVFLLGIVQGYGYTGTTPIRKMSDDDWKSFADKYVASNSDAAKYGTPYFFEGAEPASKDGAVTFDQRLGKILSYLSSSRDSSQKKCGISGQHEVIGLSIEADKTSDLSHPITNAQSASTVYRGVGVRITSVDRIKCTQICPNPLGGITYTPFSPPGFLIPLDGKKIKRTQPVPTGCTVECAVDYYPYGAFFAPGLVSAREIIPPSVPLEIAILNPTLTSYVTYNYPGPDDFDRVAHQAGIYKIAQIVYELMHADDKGCQSEDGNRGGKRLIPYTVIFPDWAWSDANFSKEGLPKLFLDLATKSFPFSLQSESPTAGIAYDPLLSQGLHLNY